MAAEGQLFNWKLGVTAIVYLAAATTMVAQTICVKFEGREIPFFFRGLSDKPNSQAIQNGLNAQANAVSRLAGLELQIKLGCNTYPRIVVTLSPPAPKVTGGLGGAKAVLTLRGGIPFTESPPILRLNTVQLEIWRTEDGTLSDFQSLSDELQPLIGDYLKKLNVLQAIISGELNRELQTASKNPYFNAATIRLENGRYRWGPWTKIPKQMPWALLEIGHSAKESEPEEQSNEFKSEGCQTGDLLVRLHSGNAFVGDRIPKRIKVLTICHGCDDSTYVNRISEVCDTRSSFNVRSSGK